MDEINPLASLRLTVEPVPRTTAGKSLSRILPKHHWAHISRRVRDEHCYKCAVCEVLGQKGGIHCHEEWEYDEAAGVQRLRALIPLCRLCHRVKHSTDLLLPGLIHLSSSFHPKLPGELLEAALERAAWIRELELRERSIGEPALYWHFAEDEELRQRFICEEAAKLRGEQRYWSDDPEGWPERYRRELQERGEMAGDEEARRWREELNRTYTGWLAVKHFVEVNSPVSLAVLEEHILRAEKTWGQRSRREWRIDFGEFY